MTCFNRIRQTATAKAFLAVGLLITASAHGYTYGPQNRAEWDGWPEYCKARYTQSLIGKNSEYARAVDSDTVARWEAQMGPCWYYLHHHCAAVLHLDRAKSARSKADRNFALQSAIKEDRGGLRYCPEANPFSANIATHMAMTYVEAGDLANATKLLDRSIRSHPEFAQAYLVKASTLRRNGKVNEALEVLSAGNAAVDGKSAELHNALGYAYLRNKEYEKAREHARLAYELGFPLPGLRQELAAAGYPL